LPEEGEAAGNAVCIEDRNRAGPQFKDSGLVCRMMPSACEQIASKEQGRKMNLRRSKKNRLDFLKESLVMAASGTAISLAPFSTISQEVKSTPDEPPKYGLDLPYRRG
jgi:hypothetical protein